LTLAEEVSICWSGGPPGMEGQWYDRAKRKAEEEKGKKAAEGVLHAVTV